MWVLAMEFLNHFRSIGKIGSRFPNPFAYFVILPMNKILQFLSVDVRIKDLRYFKFLFVINLNWRWRYLEPTLNS